MQIRIDLFGRVAARSNTKAIAGFPTRKTAELLLALAVHPGQPMNRRDLIAMLWPESRGIKANNRLSATLYMLRKTLEGTFGATGAALVSAGEGAIWLEGDFVSAFDEIDRAWRAFQSATPEDGKTAASVAFLSLYAGHLGAELAGEWFEPLQSLWASRWTEAAIWRAREGLDSVDDLVGRLAKIQPILPVTRSLANGFLNGIGRGDLAESWSGPARPRVATHALVAYPKYNVDASKSLIRRPTLTAIVVEPAQARLLRDLVELAGSSQPWVGSSQVFCARNPIIARRFAAEIRTQHPLARIYISTEVASPDERDDGRLLERLDGLQPGETLLNAAAASLIEQHDRNVVMERPLGKSGYRLL
ncbi:MAG: hypothetical protein JSS71_06925 [Armatimonadetes bacterium]|nr:hypothetical protein [Armatimonadota bacterium]MBX3107635.1 hypothetical protein [Fimbriimonadaceae bacterium]